jgi:cobalt/nickel transport system permease protein
MHIPDGFLSAPVAVGTGVVSAAAVGAALRRVRPEQEPGLAPRMGMTAAYIFAAQMVNFPVAAGTSGHLLGALLAAVLVGPSAAAVVMAAVFVIQTFFFLDGGHTALGANVLNMGLAGAWGGYAAYRALAGAAPGPRRCLWAAGIAAWCSVMLGAALTAAQLALSGTIAGRLVFPAMLGAHALIGLGEAVLTAAALGLLWRVRPDLITGRDADPAAAGRWRWAALSGLAAVAALAPLASQHPDGLERVAEILRFDRAAADPSLPGPFPDYTLPGAGERAWIPIVVSLIGSSVMLASLAALVRLRRRFSYGHSPLMKGERGEGRGERVDARVKVGCLLGLVLAAVLLPAQDAGKVVILAVAALAWVVLERTPARWLAARALVLLPFVGLAALSLPALREIGAPPSVYGLIFLRAATSLLATAAFLAGTAEAEVVGALAAYRVPAPLITTMTFALRYIRLLGAEAGRMLQARSARAAGGGTLALRAGVGGSIVGSLFIRSFERAERVSLAMEARGYRGGEVLPGRKRLHTLDLLFGAGFALFLVGICLWV